jgi:hypothetical protein
MRGVLAIAVVLLLGACASQAPRHAAASAPAPLVRPVAPERDLMLKLLVAQFALQGNDLAAAAHGFVEASALSVDPALAEQATRLALSQKDWPLATQALSRWRQLVPNDPGILQAQAWIALGEKRVDDARSALAAIAARADDGAWRLIAQVLLNADDKAAAAGLLASLIAPEPREASEANRVALSQLAFKLGDKALARRLADAAVARFHGVDAYMWSARLALDRGDKSAARAMYCEALARQPAQPRRRGG